MEQMSPRVAAVVRQLPAFSRPELDELLLAVAEFAEPSAVMTSAVEDAERRVAALRAVEVVARHLQLAAGVAPTSSQFTQHASAVAPGWNTARVIRIFGSWNEATTAYRGSLRSLTARQRSRLRRARRGVFRDREDYISGVATWLATDPASETTADYDVWAIEHNETVLPGGTPVVSYSMLRKTLPWDWQTVKQIARGQIDPATAPLRSGSRSLLRSGPHDLVAFADVRRILGLGTTAARNRSYRDGFPPPAYTQRRPPGVRLWRRVAIEAYAKGTVFVAPDNELQEVYLDAHEVAARLGLARITVTTGSSPRVPEPTVLLGGLQLWLAADIRADP